MAEKTVQEYIKELFDLRARALPAQAPSTPLADSSGSLIVNATVLKQLYPVSQARVTVFTGDYENMRIVETGYTDQSGKSPVFKLRTPSKQISLDSAASALPYELYNVEVVADGYVTRVNMNIPVFADIVSSQSVDLLPVSSAQGNTAPQIIDVSKAFDL